MNRKEIRQIITIEGVSYHSTQKCQWQMIFLNFDNPSFIPDWEWQILEQITVSVTIPTKRCPVWQSDGPIQRTRRCCQFLWRRVRTLIGRHSARDYQLTTTCVSPRVPAQLGLDHRVMLSNVRIITLRTIIKYVDFILLLFCYSIRLFYDI